MRFLTDHLCGNLIYVVDGIQNVILFDHDPDSGASYGLLDGRETRSHPDSSILSKGRPVAARLCDFPQFEPEQGSALDPVDLATISYLRLSGLRFPYLKTVPLWQIWLPFC